jgi:hypothetical protein
MIVKVCVARLRWDRVALPGVFGILRLTSLSDGPSGWGEHYKKKPRDLDNAARATAGKWVSYLRHVAMNEGLDSLSFYERYLQVTP